MTLKRKRSKRLTKKRMIKKSRKAKVKKKRRKRRSRRQPLGMTPMNRRKEVSHPLKLNQHGKTKTCLRWKPISMRMIDIVSLLL